MPAHSLLTAEVYSLTELSEWIPLGKVTIVLSDARVNDGAPITLPLQELKGCVPEGTLTLLYTCSQSGLSAPPPNRQKPRREKTALL